MANKYHISKDGTAGICRATKGKCPLGGEDQHYGSLEEANEAFQKKMEEEQGNSFGIKERKMKVDKDVRSDDSQKHKSIIQQKISHVENFLTSLDDDGMSLGGLSEGEVDKIRESIENLGYEETDIQGGGGEEHIIYYNEEKELGAILHHSEKGEWSLYLDDDY